MKLNVTCNNCNNEFTMSNEQLIREEIKIEGSEERVWLTFFDCPNCKHRYSIILDTEKTMALKDKMNMKVARITEMTLYGEKVHANQYKSVLGLKVRIENQCKALISKYNKSFYQLGDIKEQLDIRLPAAKIAGEEETK